MARGDPEADGCAVVLDVDREGVQPERVHEPQDDLVEALEGVIELVLGRKRALAVGRVVGRDEMKLVGQGRNEVAKHERGRREPVQEQNGRIGLIATLAVEDVEAVDLDRSVPGGCSGRWDAHRFSPRFVVRLKAISVTS